jgi:hypothetical protein
MLRPSFRLLSSGLPRWLNVPHSWRAAAEILQVGERQGGSGEEIKEKRGQGERDGKEETEQRRGEMERINKGETSSKGVGVVSLSSIGVWGYKRLSTVHRSESVESFCF